MPEPWPGHLRYVYTAVRNAPPSPGRQAHAGSAQASMPPITDGAAQVEATVGNLSDV